jgi:8-oxo-dGTP pyrophosphatase MutT (NUDIX family)
MYKVFFNQSVIFLCNSSAKELHVNQSIELTKLDNLSSFIKVAESEDGYSIALKYHNLPKLWKAFKKLFKVKIAAGGLVTNTNNEYLFIFRKGLWDLPKGHVEKKESIEDGAIREVTEECGICPLELGKLITTTYHTYYIKGKPILKYSYWYNMKYPGNQVPIPQTEEGITKVIWAKPEEANLLLTKAFPSIGEVFENLAK